MAATAVTILGVLAAAPARRTALPLPSPDHRAEVVAEVDVLPRHRIEMAPTEGLGLNGMRHMVLAEEPERPARVRALLLAMAGSTAVGAVVRHQAPKTNVRTDSH